MEHTFQMRNSGSEPLKIKGIKPGRGCEVIRYDPIIPPGRQGNVKVRISTKGSAGEVFRRVVVHADHDPVCPRRILGLTLQVTPAVSITPNRIFLTGFPDEEIKTRVVIRGNRDVPLTLKVKDLTASSGVTFCLKQQEEKNVFYLDAVNTQTHPGTYRGRLLFETNEPLRPVLAIPVFGRIMEDLQVFPKSVDFGLMTKDRWDRLTSRSDGKPGESVVGVPEREVFIRLNRGADLKIEEASLRGGSFKLTVDEIEKGKVYRIRVRPSGERLEKGAWIRDAIVAKTNQEKHPQLEIPVTLRLE